MKLDSIEAVYMLHLKDLYSVEKQLAAALQKLAEAATKEELKQGFQAHLEQTKQQTERLDEIFSRHSVSAGRRKSKGIAAIIEEGQEVIDAKGDGDVKDAALIAAAQRTEHYEIAVYGTAVALAKQLGHTEDQQSLQTSLDEEKEMDRKLSSLGTGEVNPAASDDSTNAGLNKQASSPKGSASMARNDYDDDRGSRGGRGGDYADSAGRHYSRESWERAQEGRSLGGQHSHGGGRGGYDDDDRGSSRSSSRGSSGGGYSSSSYDNDDRGGSSSRGGYGGGGSRSSSRYDDDDRGGFSSRGYNGGGSRGSSRDDDDRGGSYDGRSRGGRYSAEMQERDEYGQFAGYNGGGSGSSSSSRGGGGRSSRDDDDDRGSYSRGGGSSGDSRGSSRYGDDDRGSSEGRSRGGRHASDMQERDEYGQFAGYGSGSSSRGSSGGGRSSRDDDDDRGGSSRGGRGGSSGGGNRGQERDEYGQFTSSRGGGSSGRSSRYDD